MELAALAVLVASLLLTLDAGKIIMMMMMMVRMLRRFVTARGTGCIYTYMYASTFVFSSFSRVGSFTRVRGVRVGTHSANVC